MGTRNNISRRGIGIYPRNSAASAINIVISWMAAAFDSFHIAPHSEDSMDRFPARSELSEPEMTSLREIVAASFMSRASLPADRRARLLSLGLIQSGMGGVMPTPMGRMLARQ